MNDPHTGLPYACTSSLIGLLRPMIKRDQVVRIWVRRALNDLYFAFDIEFDPFEGYERFAEIMGMEKFLKAVLLFARANEFESLPDTSAKIKINKIASSYGHRFDEMILAVTDIGIADFEKIKNTDYDGYLGSELVAAVSEGYMETRYPVPTQVSDKFPIGDTGFTHDPLSSSGITKFIYAVCNSCYFFLSGHIDFIPSLGIFVSHFSERESFKRFNNLFWESRCHQPP